jgi:hypothetical protein
MNGLLLPVQIESIKTRRDKTISILLCTQELSPARAGELFNLMNKVAACYIKEKHIDQSEVDAVDKLDPEFKGKTQSQRMRNLLYLNYEQNKEGFKEFNSYYHAKMEGYIEALKTNLS